ncbi:MAG: PEP-CTERM/exosortase system-associated acyltransferase [Magnetospiraceae bacterium]
MSELIDAYNSYFEVVPADTPDLQHVVFKLRYQVLAVEHGYLDPADYPDGEETDEFDDASSHWLLRHRPSGAFAGSVRLVLPQSAAPHHGLPILEHCTAPEAHDPDILPPDLTGEISRFNVSKDFRRRLTDGSYPDEKVESFEKQQQPGGELRRVMPHITLGLMQAVIRSCSENHISHVAATLEPSLLRLLSRVGIFFDPMGPLVDLYGKRQPCVRDLGLLLDQVRQENEDVWAIMTDKGRYWRSA